MAKLLEKTRYISLFGIVSLLVASFVAFGWGTLKMVTAITIIVTSYGKDPRIAVYLIELVDGFLIATALFVFAASMYELFIDKVDLPDWMLAHNLHELKAKLSGVIILVMAVKFLEHFIEWKEPYDTLLFGAAMAIVSITLIALSHFGGKD